MGFTPLSQTSQDNEPHFAFGANWSSYSRQISAPQVQQACTALVRLLQLDSLKGLTFLDVGCGSGLHALAALLLGANKVVAIDYDPHSVETTIALLSKYEIDRSKYIVKELSVFDLSSLDLDPFDIV